MKHERIEADPLFAGFYSTADAARLLGVTGPKLRGWLNGWSKSSVAPIIDRDFKGTSTISFLDLMELRFVEFFRAQGVSMQTLRRSAALARKDWEADHPFALSNAKYLTDRKKVFAQVAKEDGDKVTWDMASGQHEMWEAIENAISRGVAFDPATDLATRWHPRPGDFPDIVVDPRLAFGKPVVDQTGIPTEVLFRQWKAERGDKYRVAKWFNVSAGNVAEAVEFELQFVA